jgi:hypothetical protein
METENPHDPKYTLPEVMNREGCRERNYLRIGSFGWWLSVSCQLIVVSCRLLVG